MHLFTFEPGDGRSYRVLYGRVARCDASAVRIVFGIAEGRGEPGMWCDFDTEQVSEETFYNCINVWATLNAQSYRTAWRLWLALTGQADDAQAAARLFHWRADWRAQLPHAIENRDAML